MGAALSSTHGVYPIGSASGTATSEGVNAEESDKPLPQVIYFYPRQREQQVKDAYDSSLQESRFQFQSPEHF
jgi:hypothetical protein